MGQGEGLAALKGGCFVSLHLNCMLVVAIAIAISLSDFLLLLLSLSLSLSSHFFVLDITER